MKLWDYLKRKTEPFAERVAFAHSGITYADLLRLECKNTEKRRFRICEGKTREEQALQILQCIAVGDIAVPIEPEYGAKNAEYIRERIGSAQGSQDLAFVMFTSGTTGKPKGVMLTDENICANLDAISGYFDLSGCSGICIARPLVHIAVLTGELLYALCSGLTVYFYEEAFVPKRLCSYIERHGIDAMCGTPTLMSALARVSVNARVPLKVCALSGEILTLEAALKLSSVFAETELYNVYGLTEHSPRVSALLPHEFISRAGSVGKPISGVQTKIKNGELLVKSPCVMKGYLGDEQDTQAKIKDGWLYTGDAAHVDSSGYIYIDGRKDNMIIRSGLNVYPEEIERAAMQTYGVDDCVAYSKESEYGTVICLEYTGNATPHDVRKRLLELLNPVIVPGKIERVKKMLRTTSGKKVRK